MNQQEVIDFSKRTRERIERESKEMIHELQIIIGILRSHRGVNPLSVPLEENKEMW